MTISRRDLLFAGGLSLLTGRRALAQAAATPRGRQAPGRQQGRRKRSPPPGSRQTGLPLQWRGPAGRCCCPAARMTLHAHREEHGVAGNRESAASSTASWIGTQWPWLSRYSAGTEAAAKRMSPGDSDLCSPDLEHDVSA